MLGGLSSDVEGTGAGIGSVRWFNPSKGYGFIAPDDGTGDVFVHIYAIERSGLRRIGAGLKVSYETARDQRTGRLSAENLKAL